MANIVHCFFVCCPGDQVLMYSELNYQNPVTDVHYHPRDHMVAFCSLGENHPVLVYSYDAHSKWL